MCKPSHLSCSQHPRYPETMWREFQKKCSDRVPHWLFSPEFQSEMPPELGVMPQPLLKLRRWDGADSWPKLDAVAPLVLSLLLSTLLSETSFLPEKREPMHRKSPRCAEFWDLQINSHPNSRTDEWLYPAFTTFLMDRRQESRMVTLWCCPATKCCRRIALSNAWGKV